MSRSLRVILVLAAFVLFGVMAYSSYRVLDDKLEHSQARRKNDNLISAITKKDPEASSSPAIAEGSASSQARPEFGVESNLQGGVQIRLDDEVSPLNSMYDFSQFYSQYPDAIGWIYCPGTPIDNCIVEADNNDYYLHRFIDGSYSVGGSLFADCCNARDFSDRNTVIYGHHMNDGTMFASIFYYKDQYYYDEHPVLYISTPTMNYRLELFSAFLTDADSEVYTFSFDGDEAYAAWLQRMLAASDFKSNVRLTTADRVVTLSTCSYEYYDARYVAIGKLVPIH